LALTTGTPRSREEVETILTSDLALALERFHSATSALLDESAADGQAKQAKAIAATEDLHPVAALARAVASE
jgi:hypothetical protein